MIHVVASIIVQEGSVAQFLEIFRNNVPAVLAEEGCIEYIPTIDCDVSIAGHVKQANKVTVLEKWESVAHLEKHLQAPHMLAYREAVKDMVESGAVSILEPA